jgi:hypothetical protein
MLVYLLIVVTNCRNLEVRQDFIYLIINAVIICGNLFILCINTVLYEDTVNILDYNVEFLSGKNVEGSGRGLLLHNLRFCRE